MDGRSVIILAGGLSRRIGQNKPLILVGGKPLIAHVLSAAKRVTDNVTVVVNGPAQERGLGRVLPQTKFVVDDRARYPESTGPILGMATGFRSVGAGYAAVLPCDVPFVSSEVLDHLFSRCRGGDAAIPVWPDGKWEPLQAVYNVESSIVAFDNTIGEGKLDIISAIKALRKVSYVSTEELRKFDRDLLTFFNVNKKEDLEKARELTG